LQAAPTTTGSWCLRPPYYSLRFPYYYSTTTQAAGERSVEDANLPSMTNPPRRNITHGVLSERYHLGGRFETDTVAMAAARQEQAASAGQQLVFLVERKIVKSDDSLCVVADSLVLCPG